MHHPANMLSDTNQTHPMCVANRWRWVWQNAFAKMFTVVPSYFYICYMFMDFMDEVFLLRLSAQNVVNFVSVWTGYSGTESKFT